MKKALIIIVYAIVACLLLKPEVGYLSDGGSVSYKAVLYEVLQVHSISDEIGGDYDEGTIVKILGIEVFNSVE